MSSSYRIQRVHAIDAHRLVVVWTDGLKGTVDFSRFIRDVPGYAPLEDPGLFRDVRLYEYGHSIYWIGPDGSEIDVCPDVLRAEVDPAVASWIAGMAAQDHRRPAAE